jgi:hypothetical protein
VADRSQLVERLAGYAVVTLASSGEELVGAVQVDLADADGSVRCVVERLAEDGIFVSSDPPSA